MGLQQEYSRNVNVTVGATSINISPKKKRKTIYIRNISTAAQVVTIALDNVNEAVAGVGVILSPGEYFVESSSDGYIAWSGDINAVASAAGAVVSILELPEVNNGI